MLYLLRDTVVHLVVLGDVDERILLVFRLLNCSFDPLQVLSVLCLLLVVLPLSRSLRGMLCQVAVRAKYILKTQSSTISITINEATP